jgi:formate hydrogenlyase subunit 3/multisubunit Na+/H+ antiporter MnhD subunit
MDEKQCPLLCNHKIASLAISGVPLFSGFLEDEILLVAFHHNIPLWVVASLLYNDCFLYVPFDVFNIL